MLEVQAQPQVSVPQKVNFKGFKDSERADIYSDREEDYDNFDKEAAEEDRDEQLDKINKSKDDMEGFADELEKNGGKVGHAAGKIVRYGATALGVVATFVAAKFSSKLAIETLKTFGKSDTAKTVKQNLDKIKTPAENAYKSIKSSAKEKWESPEIQDRITKFKSKGIGKKIVDFLEDKNVKKYTESLRTTVKSFKDTKITGKRVQSWVENIMAGTTTGSVIVDDISGRNKDKSNMDLAAGV